MYSSAICLSEAQQSQFFTLRDLHNDERYEMWLHVTKCAGCRDALLKAHGDEAKSALAALPSNMFDKQDPCSCERVGCLECAARW